MIEVFVLLLACVLMAKVFSLNTNGSRMNDIFIERNKLRQDNSIATLVFIMMMVVMTLFIGLRSRMNDTAVYIRNFNSVNKYLLQDIYNVDWSLGANPFFEIYQCLIKTFLSSNGQFLVFLTAICTVPSYLFFVRKYSVDFTFSVFFLIASTTYAFTAAAMKQTMAMAIGIWAIPAWLKRKRARAIALLAIGALIHPYVVLYAIGFFLVKRIWDWKTTLILLGTIVLTVFFTRILPMVTSIASSFGDDYELSFFMEGGVSLLRVAFYLFPSVLTFIYRGKIRSVNCYFQNVCINMSFLASCFMIVASVSSGNLIGRVANYFDIFNCLTLAYVLRLINGNNKRVICAAICVGSLFFYFRYYLTYYQAWGNICFYGHVSIGALFSMW